MSGDFNEGSIPSIHIGVGCHLQSRMVKPNTLKLMKTAKQIKINNHTYTITECSVCGATTRIKGSLDTNGCIKILSSCAL